MKTAFKKTLQVSPPDGGFTRLDLLVMFVVAGLCFLMLLPALARTQTDSRAFRCLNNHRQLCRAWLMYADDNNDGLATSAFEAFSTPSQPTWAAGHLDWINSADNTNTIYLTDPQYSIMATYFGKDARLFKCPADQYLSAFQRSIGWKERVRSVSQDIYAANNLGAGDSAYAQVTKLTALLNPKPAETWVSIDEHPDSINDARFWAPNPTSWIDLPANYHDGGAGVAYADGRAEIHRWQGSVLQYPVRYATFALPPTSPSDPDLLWLRYRTPRKPGMN